MFQIKLCLVLTIIVLALAQCGYGEEKEEINETLIRLEKELAATPIYVDPGVNSLINEAKKRQNGSGNAAHPSKDNNSYAEAQKVAEKSGLPIDKILNTQEQNASKPSNPYLNLVDKMGKHKVPPDRPNPQIAPTTHTVFMIMFLILGCTLLYFVSKYFYPKAKTWWFKTKSKIVNLNYSQKIATSAISPILLILFALFIQKSIFEMSNYEIYENYFLWFIIGIIILLFEIKLFETPKE